MHYFQHQIKLEKQFHTKNNNQGPGIPCWITVPFCIMIWIILHTSLHFYYDVNMTGFQIPLQH